MKSIQFRLLIAALAVLLGTALANSQTDSQSDEAQAPPAQPMHMHGYGQEFGMGHMGFLAHKLNLTDEQKTQMKTIMQKERPSLKPLFQQDHQVDLQLRQYVEGTFDAAKVQALAAQKAQIQTQMTVAKTRIHNEMFQLLTPDQQSQLKQMEARHEARVQQHMQEHMDDAPPAPPEQ